MKAQTNRFHPKSNEITTNEDIILRQVMKVDSVSWDVFDWTHRGNQMNNYFLTP